MMSKEFEEAKLVISADIVYDPEDEDIKEFHNFLQYRITNMLNDAYVLHKNIKVELKGFICEQS